MYVGGSTDDSPDSTYEPDRDTSQPNIESYEDPFSPSTAPFKRLRAFDSLTADYTLKVSDKATSLISIGGEVGPEDEPFYGDFSVELLPDDLVRIPSVGPGARVIKMHVSPAAQVSLLRDGAENWFIRGGGAQAGQGRHAARDRASDLRLGLPRRDLGPARAQAPGRLRAPRRAGRAGLQRHRHPPGPAAQGGAHQDGRVLPSLPALGGAAEGPRRHVPRPRPVQEGGCAATARSPSW
jgi:hypothetical protein